MLEEGAFDIWRKYLCYFFTIRNEHVHNIRLQRLQVTVTTEKSKEYALTYIIYKYIYI